MANIFIAIFLSIISTGIMSYISMAAPIGPWIAPTIVCCATICFLFIKKSYEQDIILVTVAASVGGIIATGFGFSFPAIFFCNKLLYAQWLDQPLYFFGLLAGLSFAAGGLGILIADLLEHELIVVQQLPFPISQLIYNLVATGNHIWQTLLLFLGAAVTTVFCILQDGLFFIKPLIPKNVTFLGRFLNLLHMPPLSIDLFPLLWAIGFITGHLITMPLLVGGLTRIFIIEPFHKHLFSHLSSIEFVLAFCSGMVLLSTMHSFLTFYKYIVHYIKLLSGYSYQDLFFFRKLQNNFTQSTFWQWLFSIVINNFKKLFFITLILGFIVLFFRYIDFPVGAIFYIIISTIVWSYQIAVIAGKIGLAPLGRFATFVMVPAMMLFHLSTVQLILLSTFVEVCCGVVADILFGRKLAQLANMQQKKIALKQWLGLFISSLVIGICFWLLTMYIPLGSSHLFAQKAQSRTLLLTAGEFNYWVLFLGALFGVILSYLNINSMLVLGGILMPLNTSLGLIVGGCAAMLVKHKERFESFCSGMFTANSLWMIFRALLTTF